MKKSIDIIVLIVLMASFSLVAQNPQGKAYYISSYKFNFDFGGKQVSEARKSRIKERQKNLAMKKYVLEFNGPVSLFKEEEDLNQETMQNSGRGGGLRMFIDDKNTGIHYKNISTHQYIAQRNVFGKQFLIKDSLMNCDWQLSDEVKIIGKYTCFKATATVPFSGDQKETTTTVTAWYTIEIPVKHGPEMFWGLPGLILELKTESRLLLCSKIELGTEEETNIIPPRRGKEVTQEKFDEILVKKTKEVKEIYNNRRKGGGRQKG